MAWRGSFVATLALLGLFPIAIASAAEPSANSPARAERSLVQEARGRHLGRSTAWMRLVHYRTGAFHTWVSDIAGRGFFLSPDGPNDPDAELDATLTAFLTPVVPGREDEHPLCRFPARRAWLDAELHFDGPLHAPSCPGLAHYESSLDTEAVTIVYAANFLKNPASAFGHTFLRLKKRRPSGATQSPEELDYGIDFVATTDTTNPFLYAFKGISGLFPGHVHYLPFEGMAREYGNREARDMWEYELALTPTEVRRLVDHLWELSRPHFTYLFLTQNCSYEVLAAIEAAAPRVDLLSHSNAVILPKDTVRALFTSPDLVRGIEYRPSLRSQYQDQVARLPPAQQAMVAVLARDPHAPLPADLPLAQRVALLDIALYVFDARTAPESERHQPEVLAGRAVLLARRAELSTSLPPPTPAPPPVDKAPELGHASARVTFGTGTTSQFGGSYTTFGYRLALHDLADSPDGAPELLQVQFLDTHARYDVTHGALTLDTLTFAEVLALNPITRFEKALSWRVRAEGIRLHDRGCPDCFAHGPDVSIGVTLATADEHAAVFVMGDAYALFSPDLDGVAKTFIRVGVGPYGGVRLRLPASTVGVVTAGWSYLPAAHLAGTFDLRGSLRTALAKDVALGIEAAAQPLPVEGQLSTYVYF